MTFNALGVSVFIEALILVLALSIGMVLASEWNEY